MSMIVTMTNAPTRTRWLIVALLFGIYMLMVIDRVSISIAAKYMMPEYQLVVRSPPPFKINLLGAEFA